MIPDAWQNQEARYQGLTNHQDWWVVAARVHAGLAHWLSSDIVINCSISEQCYFGLMRWFFLAVEMTWLIYYLAPRWFTVLIVSQSFHVDGRPDGDLKIGLVVSWFGKVFNFAQQRFGTVVVQPGIDFKSFWWLCLWRWFMDLGNSVHRYFPPHSKHPR